VIARRSASTVYELSVLPGPPQLEEQTYSAAVTLARNLAERQKVDVWYSDDHIHFTCISRCREVPAGTGPGDSRPDPEEMQ